MELTNEFRVGVPPAEAWKVLVDVEQIAPCLPGAQLMEVEGEEYRGTVKVKVGPITATYKGAATFVEQDEGAGRVVLRAEGREARGQGNASALVTATLTPDGDGTAVKVVTDLTITGRVAQFGRGVLADVSAKLLEQFVACLEQTVLATPLTAAALAANPELAARPEPEPEPEAPEQPAPSPSTARVAASLPGVPAEAGPDEPVGGSEWAPPDATAPPLVETEPPSGVRRIESAPAQPVDLLDTAGGPVARRALPVAGVIVVLWLFRRRRRRRRRQRQP